MRATVRFDTMSAPATPESAADVDGALARVPPLLLLIVGTALTVASGRILTGVDVDPSTPWYTSLFLLLMGIALAAIGAAVAIDPRPVLLRRALAGSALAWLAILATGAGARDRRRRRRSRDLVAVIALMIAIVGGLLGLAASTPAVSDDRTPALGRVGRGRGVRHRDPRRGGGGRGRHRPRGRGHRCA